MPRILYWFFCFLITITIYPSNLLGQIEFHEVFPNTIDDTNLEYIELRNIGCTNQDIGGYILEDASAKRYVFGANSIIVSHENFHVSRLLSKIILNNTDEILYFKDPMGSIISQFSYTNSIKGEKINNPNSIDIDCQIIDTNTGSSDIIGDDTGSIATGSTIDISLGDPEGENTFSGEINTPSIDSISSTSTNTGSSNVISGEMSNDITLGSGNEDILTGVTFPEIIPYLQYPTNAIFSGGIFDCTNQNPCRINLTFDPIFNSSFLQKNYDCEIIIETGSLADCNPNTLYFISGSSITFRLKSKIELNQSLSKTWNVIYKNLETTGVFELSDSGSENIFSGEISSFSGVEFPEIIPVFQNYTNTVFSGNILNCITSPCRVNMNLESIFTGSFQSKDYTCEVIYSGSKYDCNPPQIYLDGTGSIVITLIHKGTKQQKNHSIKVIQTSSPVVENKKSGDVASPIKDTNPPIAILEYDGKLKSYHEQIGDYEMNCYTDTCSINLTGEKSYDEEGGKVEFLWYYGLNDIKTSKDPGERKYGIGDHQIWLRVIDAAGNVAHIRYYIHVLGEKTDSHMIEKVKKTKVVTDVLKKEKVKKIKKKIKKMTFFDPPKISLQKSKFKISNTGYICKATTKTCSLNLKIDNPQKGLIYTWIYENGTILDSKNPKSQSFTPGKYTIKIIAGYSHDTPIWNKDILVEVIKIQKPKKVRKQKTKKIVQISGSNKEKVEQNNIEKSPYVSSKNEEQFPMAVLALIGGIMPIYFIKKHLPKTKSKI